jgi:hypothetical protein
VAALAGGRHEEAYELLMNVVAGIAALGDEHMS